MGWLAWAVFAVVAVMVGVTLWAVFQAGESMKEERRGRTPRD